MQWVVVYYPLLAGQQQSPPFNTVQEAEGWAASLPFGVMWHLAAMRVAAPHAMHLGKKPARPDSIKFKLDKYLAGTKSLVTPPVDFGHEEFDPPISWGMLGNDQYGVCVVAGAMHETLLWNRMAGKDIQFTTKDCLEDFTAITGEQPSPDAGADMQQAASFRRTTGLRDAKGNRHKIGAYVALRPGNLKDLYTAMYLFGAVGIGFRFPSTGFDQFARHQSWHVVSGSTFDGSGHYVPCVALRSNIVTVTWGRFQAMRPSFYQAYCDEAVAYVSEEALTAGKSPEGFDYKTLLKDLAALPRGPAAEKKAKPDANKRRGPARHR